MVMILSSVKIDIAQFADRRPITPNITYVPLSLTGKSSLKTSVKINQVEKPSGVFYNS